MKESKFIKNRSGDIVSLVTREVLTIKEVKKKYGNHPAWKKFEMRLNRDENDPSIQISKKEWDKLKAGDRLISPGGTIRWIVDKETHRSNMVTFKKHMMNGYRSHFTCYCYNDLKREYRILHRKPNRAERREFLQLTREYAKNDYRLFPHLYTKEGKKRAKAIL